ncbi:glycine cleavage system H-protein subunit [Mycoemilia scoparia]|uniref:Glycine cleavage system H protein n=1 Tax=Mycoemilia scoparia TaxID=417184 RepID=A0A9W8A9C9_9FUNG|nr:glycine cleavage system H-protein subunit [Mycoemilia scoparia]
MSLRILTQSFIRQRAFAPATSTAAFARFYATKKFTSSHEWVEVENGVGTVGLTDYAQNSLGDIVYVELPEVDSEVENNDVIGVVESVKAASDIYSPLTGTITETNAELESKPKLINTKPDSDGWLFKIKIANDAEVNDLLDEAAYKKLIEDK